MKRLGVALIAGLVATGSTACDKDDVSSLGEGESIAIEVDGLRGIIERHAAAAGDRIMVAGRTGRDLHGRLIWASTAGDVLIDHELAGIDRPEDVTACIDGQDADVYWVPHGHDRLYRTRIRGDALLDAGDSPTPMLTSEGRLSVGAVVGLQEGCGVCMFDAHNGNLVCQLGLDPTEPRGWQTGELGEWSVLSMGDGLVIADWGADEDGKITVRMAPLDDGHPQQDGWLHSYQVGQLPSILDPAEHGVADPSFVPAGDHVKVVFVDGTDWFTRLFVQRFPMTQPLPQPPDLLQSCRGTCKIRWTGVYDDSAFIWYEDQNGDWAISIDDGWEGAREQFAPPPNVEALAGGFFKMGLGNEVANWWGLVTYEVE
jgi:hypothetical protein